VEQKDVVPLVELRMGSGGAVNDRLVVTKEVALLMDGNSQVHES